MQETNKKLLVSYYFPTSLILRSIFCRLHAGFRLDFLLNPEDVGDILYFFETFVDFERPAGCYISEDGILHNHRYDNLKHYIVRLKAIFRVIDNSVKEDCALLI
jgi:hypothetical protein